MAGCFNFLANISLNREIKIAAIKLERCYKNINIKLEAILLSVAVTME